VQNPSLGNQKLAERPGINFGATLIGLQRQYQGYVHLELTLLILWGLIRLFEYICLGKLADAIVFVWEDFRLANI